MTPSTKFQTSIKLSVMPKLEAPTMLLAFKMAVLLTILLSLEMEMLIPKLTTRCKHVLVLTLPKQIPSFVTHQGTLLAMAEKTWQNVLSIQLFIRRKAEVNIPLHLIDILLELILKKWELNLPCTRQQDITVYVMANSTLLFTTLKNISFQDPVNTPYKTK